MKVDLQVIKDELEKTKNSFITIDPMCDAYKTEQENRRYNDELNYLIQSLENIIDNYNKLSEEEWDLVNSCFYYGYKIKEKETGKETLLYKIVGEKLYLLSGVKVGQYYKHDFSKEEIKAKFDYVKDEKGEIIKECQKTKYFSSYHATASYIVQYLENKEDEQTILEKIKEYQTTSKFKSATYKDLYYVKLHGYTHKVLESLIKKGLVEEKVINYTKENKEMSFSTYKLV